MKSRSVFLTAFLWWLVGAAVVGATYPLLIIGFDSVFDTGTSDVFDDRIWRTVVGAAGFGIVHGVVAALANAGLSTALQRRPRPIAPGTQLIAGTWAIATLWLMPEASPHQIERITVTLIMVVFVWSISPLIYKRYRDILAPLADDDGEARPHFKPVHMLTSSADSDDVASFVRNNLRGYGSGNALFRLQAGGIGESSASTEVLVDAGGTGHALNLAIDKWENALVDGVSEMPGFLVTDDKTLALAPAGLSAAAVVSEGISLVQKVSGDSDVKVQFEGFGF